MFEENSERRATKTANKGGQNTSSKFLLSFATSLVGGSRISTCVRHYERRQRERARVLYIYFKYYIFVEKRETEDKER